MSFYPKYIIISDQVKTLTEFFLIENLKKRSGYTDLFLFSPVVKGRSCQDHGVVIGPLRGVAPPRPGSVPVVAPRRITDDALWKALPHDESKVHLRGGEMKGRNRADQVRFQTIFCVKSTFLNPQIRFCIFTHHTFILTAASSVTDDIYPFSSHHT